MVTKLAMFSASAVARNTCGLRCNNLAESGRVCFFARYRSRRTCSGGVMPKFGARRKKRPRHQRWLISAMISAGSSLTSVSNSIGATMECTAQALPVCRVCSLASFVSGKAFRLVFFIEAILLLNLKRLAKLSNYLNSIQSFPDQHIK